MKRTLLFTSFLFLINTIIFAATPDFSMVGFATLNGGTTGGQGGQVVTPTTFAELKQYAEDPSTPYIIKIDKEFNTGIKAFIESGSGKIAPQGASSIETTYGEIIRLGSNKTLLGVEDKAFFNRIGIVVQCESNIIIQNIKFTMQDVPIDKSGENKIVAFRNGAEVLIGDPDCICIQADAESVPKANLKSYNIWIDHCEFYNYPKSSEHKDRYDGLLDMKNDVQFVTVSWCYFHDHSKACLFGKGNSDKFDRTTTLHHNYFSNIQGSRLPLLRHGRHHYYNNYQENCQDGLDPRTGSESYVENCYFKATKQPICDPDGGLVTHKNNIYEACRRIATGEVNIDGGKIDKVYTFTPASFNPKEHYNYTLDAPETIPELVTSYAGIGKIGDAVSSNSEINVDDNDSEIYANGDYIYVRVSSDNLVNVFNIEGTLLYSAQLKTGTESFYVAWKGIYIVQLVGNNKTIKSQKVVL